MTVTVTVIYTVTVVVTVTVTVRRTKKHVKLTSACGSRSGKRLFSRKRGPRSLPCDAGSLGAGQHGVGGGNNYFSVFFRCKAQHEGECDAF